MQKKSQFVRSQHPVWIVVLAILLWGINGLTIQQVEYELNTIVALSQQRLPTLIGLQGQLILDRNIKVVQCSVVSPKDRVSDLATVRIRVRSTNRRSLSGVEKAMDEVTCPTFPSNECEIAAKQVRLETWNLETWKHLEKVVREDQQREQEQVETDSEKSFIRLVGFRSTPVEDGGINDLCEQSETRLAELQQCLELAKKKSIGFLSLTGRQLQYPIVSPVAWWRLLVLVLMGSACWFSASLCLRHDISFRWPTISATSLISRIPIGNQRNNSRSSPTLEGIPFLGTVVLCCDQALSLESKESECIVVEEVRRREEPIYIPIRKIAINVASVLLWMWLGLLVIRLASDELWRELFFASPLAGLTRLLGGIP